ncbi:hypothetical protein [Bhargavaea beijingensis]|nr:hypothetical protein [Bhargavaea beijingensis]
MRQSIMAYFFDIEPGEEMPTGEKLWAGAVAAATVAGFLFPIFL